MTITRKSAQFSKLKLFFSIRSIRLSMVLWGIYWPWTGNELLLQAYFRNMHLDSHCIYYVYYVCMCCVH